MRFFHRHRMDSNSPHDDGDMNRNVRHSRSIGEKKSMIGAERKGGGKELLEGGSVYRPLGAGDDSLSLAKLQQPQETLSHLRPHVSQGVHPSITRVA